MIAYWALFGVFAFAGALTHPRSDRRYTPALIAVGLLLILAIGLRYRVGGDWGAYEFLFRHLRLLELGRAIGTIDPAYALINWLVGQAGGGIWAVNLICAAVFTYGLLEFCRDQPDPMLAVLVGIPYLVIVVAMGYTRQAAALGLVMVALSQFFRGSIARMAIALVLAASFHKSAVIVMPLIALAASRRRVLTILLLGVIAVITYYLLVSASLDRLVANYVTAKYNSSGATIRIAMNLAPAAIFLLSSGRFTSDREERRLWTIFSAGSFVSLILLLTTPSSTAVDRVSLYLIPLQLFVLSRLPKTFPGGRSPSLPLKFGVIAYSMIVQFIWLNYADNAAAWVPYRNYITDPGER